MHMAVRGAWGRGTARCVVWSVLALLSGSCSAAEYPAGDRPGHLLGAGVHPANPVRSLAVLAAKQAGPAGAGPMGARLRASEAQSQTPTREEVMAAYLLNFGRNVAWPDEDHLDVFTVKLITANSTLVETVTRMFRSKTMRNHPVRITAEPRLTSVDNVQVVFVGHDRQESVIDVFDRIEGKPVLLVCDRYADRRVVMINFVETADHTLRFEINKANILNQGLALMPDLVLLGGTEIDVAALYRESQVSLRGLQKQVEGLRQREAELNRTLSTSGVEMARQQRAITMQSAAIDSQRIQLALQRSLLDRVLADIARKQDTLRLQSSIIERREGELRRQRAEIEQGDRILAEQRGTIEQQRLAIEHQSRALEKQGETISLQQKILVLAIAVAVLGLGFLISIFRGYTQRKKINARLTKEIEERRAIEVALGKSEDLYYRAPCGYHSLDGNGVIVQVNDTELEWLGYTRDEVIGRLHFGDLLEPAARQEFEHGFAKFKLEGEVRNQELELVRKDRSLLPIMLSATVIRDEHGAFLMSRSTSVDITDRKHAELEIRRLNQVLEQRVKERTRELETANKELEAFAYSVSHDLRAPLRGIDGFSQLLLEQYTDHFDARGNDYLRRVRAGAQRMGHLIDAMLGLSRVSRAGLSLRPLNLSQIAREVMRDLTDAAPGRRCTIAIADDLAASGDPRLLRVVLENLLDNAWKYSGKVTHAQIEVGRMDTPEGPAFFVRDNGAGFDMQYVHKLFGAFQRLHTMDEFPGTGIGLATVQRIIHKHGGSVWATGRIGAGATFYFTLP